MSGTSADGIDVALVRISGPTASPRARLVAFADFQYPPPVREAVLRLANGAQPLRAKSASSIFG
jgi:anhydro-N-acetylmuramic acid kinase